MARKTKDATTDDATLYKGDTFDFTVEDRETEMSTTTTNPDGSVTTTNPDGTTTTTNADGSTTTVNPDGSVTTTNPDGSTSGSFFAFGEGYRGGITVSAAETDTASNDLGLYTLDLGTTDSLL